jgi:rod shape determining protein RodA
MTGGRSRRDFDYLLVALAVAVSLYGLLAIASVTLHAAGTAYVRRQAVYVAVGLAVMAAFALIDYHAWTRWATALYAVNVGLLAIVFVVGRHALGAQRWLQVGPVPVQPSELAKLIVILTLGAQLAPRAGRLRRWSDLAAPCAHMLLPAALVALQPDLGSSLVFVAILVGMLYVAGVPGWRLAAACAGVLAVAVGGIVAHNLWHLPIPMKEYQLKRLLVFINPQGDPLGAGYNIIQSEIAIGSGRVAGMGLFGGANELSYLPESHTDFVFAAIGRSFGFVGATALLLAFLLILWRGVRVVVSARDEYGAVVAAGVVSMIGFHVILNAGMTMGVMPVTGVPLPFTSYGGSALVVDFAAVGLLLSIHLRHRKIQF